MIDDIFGCSYLKEQAPAQGWVIAYFRDSVFYQRYDSINAVEDLCTGKELLEIHLFDNDKEYRCVKSQSKRFSNGYVEHVADFADDGSVFSESVLTEDRFASASGKIRILNHVKYTETGTAEIDDYRLVAEG